MMFMAGSKIFNFETRQITDKQYKQFYELFIKTFSDFAKRINA